MIRPMSVPVFVTAFAAIGTLFLGVYGEQPLDLGLAEPYAILAGSTVTSTGTVGTTVNGNIGIFPGSARVGFPPAVLNGDFDAANGASSGAQGALTTAYNVLAGKAFNTTLSNQDLGGMTLLPGVYKFNAAAAMNGMLTLDANGDPNAIWTFQIGSYLNVAGASSIIFKDSIGNPDYVYWQVGTTATLAAGVPMVGNILALTSIIVNDGTTVTGRCLARNAEVTLDRSVITKPVAITASPSTNPTGGPTITPSTAPSANPSVTPSVQPTLAPSVAPSIEASVGPTFVNQPTVPPSFTSTSAPSRTPSANPSRTPSSGPTTSPTKPGTFVGRGELPIDLGLAAPYAILAGSTVTSTGTVGTVITGNIGIFPGSAITGFPPAVINGAIDLATGASAGAKGDLTIAYNTLAAKAFNTTLSNQDLGGMTLIPGVYKFNGGAAMNGVLTLDARGDAAAVWIFQIGSFLNVAQGSSVIFKDSIGNPDYVYWQVGTTATLAMLGNILAFASIILNDGVTVKGRCLARNAEVTLDKSVITVPVKVSFRVAQTISGVSLEQYHTDSTRNAAALKDAIAETMAGVLPADIKNFKVSAGPTSAAATLALRSNTARALATSSILLNYDVVASSTSTAQELQNQLRSAVNDGRFNTYLQAAAVENGAMALQTATSDSVETETIGEDDSSSDKSALSDGGIIGIAIGGFFALVLVAAIIYLCTHKGSSSAVGATHSSRVTTQEV